MRWGGERKMVTHGVFPMATDMPILSFHLFHSQKYESLAEASGLLHE